MSTQHTDVVDENIPGREKAVDIDSIIVNGPPPIEVASESALKGGTMELEKFMSEVLEVHLHEPAHENEPTLAWVGVNGDALWLARGGTYQLKRYHVEALVHGKTGRIAQKRHIAPDGSQSYINSEVLNIAYPFTVISDPNPRGPAWLRNLMQQAS